MAPFQSSIAHNARLSRRNLIALGAGSLALAACSRRMPMTASKTPALDIESLEQLGQDIARRIAPGVLGAGLTNLESGQTWVFSGDRPFPMQSVFKLPMGAAVLAEVEAGRLRLDERLTIRSEDLSPPYSPIADAWPARADYDVAELLAAAVRDSDNTAADVLMRRIGGPGAVTAWLTAKDVTGLTVDRYERQLQTDFFGMASFREDWRGREKFLAAKNAVDPAARRTAVARYLADPRDTATPRGMLDFLDKLDDGAIIGPPTRQRLFDLMTGGRVTSRLAAALPAGARLLHKTGTSWTEQGLNGATNDVGLIILADERRYAAAVFLAGSTLDDAGRDGVIAELGRGMIKSLS
jgi:beta-lactamase class A